MSKISIIASVNVLTVSLETDETAVDHKVFPRDVRRRITGYEHRRTLNIVTFPRHPAEGRCLRVPPHELGVMIPENSTRRDGVDSNPVRGQISGRIAGEAQNACLAGRVVHKVRPHVEAFVHPAIASAQARDTGDIDD